MRKLLFAGTVAALAAFPSLANAQVYIADSYPPAAVVGPPAAVVGPPVVAAPMVESQVYLAPGTIYVQPGTEWEDRPIIVEGRRYYRDCWWDWGRRRCELKPWW
jgi:hypothetical protein